MISCNVLLSTELEISFLLLFVLFALQHDLGSINTSKWIDNRK